MVCKEELCSIFKGLHPHRRIDLMCGLLDMCLPLELRFLGSFVEDLGKKDFNFLRDWEHKANNRAEVNKLLEVGDLELRHKMLVYLALLHSSNTTCSNQLFILIMAYLERALYNHVLLPALLNPDTLQEILTILIMASNHPAFTFDQRNRLYDYYRIVEQQRSDNIYMPSKIIIPDPVPVSMVADHTADITSSVTLPSSPADSSTTSSPLNKKVFIKSVEVKGSRKLDKRNEFRMEVTWSNGETNEVCKTYQQLQQFHATLVKLVTDDSTLLSKHDKKSSILTGNSHFHRRDDNFDRIYQNITTYLRKLSAVPQEVLGCDHVITFFREKSHMSAPSPPAISLLAKAIDTRTTVSTPGELKPDLVIEKDSTISESSVSPVIQSPPEQSQETVEAPAEETDTPSEVIAQNPVENIDVITSCGHVDSITVYNSHMYHNHMAPYGDSSMLNRTTLQPVLTPALHRPPPPVPTHIPPMLISPTPNNLALLVPTSSPPEDDAVISQLHSSVRETRSRSPSPACVASEGTTLCLQNLYQVLKQLHLSQYSDALSAYSIEQLLAMKDEEIDTHSEIPKSVLRKLCTHLEQLSREKKLPNGLDFTNAGSCSPSSSPSMSSSVSNVQWCTPPTHISYLPPLHGIGPYHPQTQVLTAVPPGELAAHQHGMPLLFYAAPPPPPTAAGTAQPPLSSVPHVNQALGTAGGACTDVRDGDSSSDYSSPASPASMRKDQGSDSSASDDNYEQENTIYRENGWQTQGSSSHRQPPVNGRNVQKNYTERSNGGRGVPKPHPHHSRHQKILHHHHGNNKHLQDAAKTGNMNGSLGGFGAPLLIPMADPVRPSVSTGFMCTNDHMMYTPRHPILTLRPPYNGKPQAAHIGHLGLYPNSAAVMSHPSENGGHHSPNKPASPSPMMQQPMPPHPPLNQQSVLNPAQYMCGVGTSDAETMTTSVLTVSFSNAINAASPSNSVSDMNHGRTSYLYIPPPGLPAALNCMNSTNTPNASSSSGNTNGNMSNNTGGGLTRSQTFPQRNSRKGSLGSAVTKVTYAMCQSNPSASHIGSQSNNQKMSALTLTTPAMQNNGADSRDSSPGLSTDTTLTPNLNNNNSNNNNATSASNFSQSSVNTTIANATPLVIGTQVTGGSSHGNGDSNHGSGGQVECNTCGCQSHCDNDSNSSTASSPATVNNNNNNNNNNNIPGIPFYSGFIHNGPIIHLPPGFLPPSSNGLIMPIPSAMPFSHNHPHFPNGFSPEVFFRSWLMQAGQQMGNVAGLMQRMPYTLPVPGHPSAPPPSHAYKQKSSTASSTCSNCGGTGHRATECKDLSMDAVSGNYHLNFQPRSDSE